MQISPWADCVVPISVERVLPNLDGREFFVGDFDALLISVLIEFCADSKSLPGSCVADQIDNDGATDERLSTPVLSDVTEHPMFNLVPFARSGGEMANRNLETEIVRELLNRQLPQAQPTPVASAGVRCDQ